MGKQVSVLSIKGKVGNVVGYSYLDSKNQKANGLRVYQGEVKNPQTDAQARQRARMLPLTSFYRHMSDVIKRGYQEVGYGQPSRRIFMRDNMKSFEGPWLVKGTFAAIPGPYIIARGSLVPITVTAVSATAATTDLGVGSVATVTTIGDLSSALMANNTDIQIGDQLTFVMAALVQGSVPAVVYRVQSIVISPDDATALPITATIADGALLFSVGLKSDEVACAAAVIQSRDGGSSHLRSFAQLAVNASALSAYYGITASDAAIASYQTAEGSNDWPVEPFSGQNASTSIDVDGTTLVGIEVLNGQAFGIDANNNRWLLKNHDGRASGYGKFLGATGWNVTIDDPQGNVLEVYADATQSINPFNTWLVQNFGYTIDGLSA